jgi:hypothetical protein
MNTINPMIYVVVVFGFAGLMWFYYFYNQRRAGRHLRDIPAFYRLRGSIEVAVEDGTRVHISIGRSDVLSPQGAAAMVGLSMLRKITTVTSDSDNPPIATAGDGLLGILARDTIYAGYRSLNLAASYDPSMGRVTGLTPFSFASGVMPLVFDESVSTSLLTGTFGSEVALITSAGERSQSRTLAGTDNLPGQAIIYASAHDPLIGEELYAGGAYLDVGPMHEASLHAQDIARWAIIIVIVLTAIGGLFGGLR